VTSFIATHIHPVKTQNKIELALRLQIIISTILMVPATYYLAMTMLPEHFHIKGVANTLDATSYDAFVCVAAGGVGGLIIGLTTEYYTSKEYQPVKALANSCRTGAATNIIYGLALGYKSVIVPVFVLAGIVYVSFALCDLYGIALAAVGMLGNLATGLTIDAYGPVCDNAGGIAEMALLPKSVREKTDALDAAGQRLLCPSLTSHTLSRKHHRCSRQRVCYRQCCSRLSCSLRCFCCPHPNCTNQRWS
jgi:H+-translocating diphosphatase